MVEAGVLSTGQHRCLRGNSVVHKAMALLLGWGCCLKVNAAVLRARVLCVRP
jgi:hypothetical protein